MTERADPESGDEERRDAGEQGVRHLLPLRPGYRHRTWTRRTLTSPRASTGETKQQTNTSDLLFPVAELVSYISEAILLLPGDVIMTGTPSGIGPMAPGDIAEVDISGIGVLRNPIIGEE